MERKIGIAGAVLAAIGITLSVWQSTRAANFERRAQRAEAFVAATRPESDSLRALADSLHKVAVHRDTVVRVLTSRVTVVDLVTPPTANMPNIAIRDTVIAEQSAQ